MRVRVRFRLLLRSMKYEYFWSDPEKRVVSELETYGIDRKLYLNCYILTRMNRAAGFRCSECELSGGG